MSHFEQKPAAWFGAPYPMVIGYALNAGPGPEPMLKSMVISNRDGVKASFKVESAGECSVRVRAPSGRSWDMAPGEETTVDDEPGDWTVRGLSREQST